jgi:hypothetical protein
VVIFNDQKTHDESEVEVLGLADGESSSENQAPAMNHIRFI